MKTSLRRLAVIGLLGLALPLSSCVSPYYYGGPGPAQQNGAVVGALGGAAVGGIVGNQSGRGLEGAAIGAVLGSLAGSSLGATRDSYYGGYYARPAPVAFRSYGYQRPYFNRGFGCRPTYGNIAFGSGFGCAPFGGGYGYGRPCW